MVRLPQLRRLGAAVALSLALAAGPAVAQGAAAADGGWLDRYNRMVFAFNSVVDEGFAAGAAWFAPPATQVPRRRVRGGLGNMMSNLVNEPLTIVSSLAVADLPTAWTATQRFAVNSTVGFLGWYDRASGYGIPPIHADLGLALCRYGVGEGGYLMVPFIGPRTVRDAVADVVLVNAILWTSLAALLGTGASIETILIAEAVEIAADVVATRQIDPKARGRGLGRDFAAVREDYLRQRRQRCGNPVASAPEAPL
ncbi:hypothetical protein STVA_24490 [Allostella vacuolata]|nr:hypothetical protein STVA_24490 [Stella vacuolata]